MTRLLERLNGLLTQLPGIGRKTAQRISFYLLKMKPEQVRELANAMLEAKEKLSYCPVCFNLTEAGLCEICSDPSRDQALICAVESPADIVALERSHGFKGVYHVLGGALSPLDGVGPADLRFTELVGRLKRLETSGTAARDAPAAGPASVEVIIATNPTTEGEATAAYIRQLVTIPGVKLTRIARGLPIGSDLDLADEVTLARALEGRREL